MLSALKQVCMGLLVMGLLACSQPPPPLVDQHGQALETQGRWLLINYWATWCAPCRKEVPALNQLQHELSDQPVLILGVNYDQLSGEALVQASASMGIDFAVLANDPAAQFDLPRSQGLPVTFLVNPKGEVAARLLGEQDQQSLLKKLRELQVIPAP